MVEQPGLFRLCRSIRSEASPLFFQLRKFHILVERGSDTLKALQRWMRWLAPTSLQNIRHLQITFRQTFKLVWLVFLDYYLRKVPCEAAIYLYAMEARDARKFKEIAAEYRTLNSGPIPHLNMSVCGWYYPWESQKCETGRSIAQLTFPARSTPLRTPCGTPTKARVSNSSPASAIDLTQDDK